MDKDHNGTIDQGELERVLSAYYKASGKPVDTGKVKSESAVSITFEVVLLYFLFKPCTHTVVPHEVCFNTKLF